MLIFIREDILVFMTGQEEIENMARQIRTIAKEYQDRPRLEVGIQIQNWVTKLKKNGLKPTQKSKTHKTNIEIENMARQIRTIAKEYQDRPRLEVIIQIKNWVTKF